MHLIIRKDVYKAKYHTLKHRLAPEGKGGKDGGGG